MKIVQSVRRLGCGFTLVELMIVVAIVAALVSLAVPQYQSYVTRTQFSEALSLFSGVRTALESQVAISGVSSRLYAADFLAGHRTEGDYVAGIEVNGSGTSLNVVVSFQDEGVSQPLVSQQVTFSWDSADVNSGWTCSVAEQIRPYASGICAPGS